MKKTLVAGISIEKAVTIAKPFASKSVVRPVLTTALVTDQHVIVTDSHRLIRITHNEDVTKNYQHHYSDKFGSCSGNYPDVSRLVPFTDSAQKVLNVNIVEWLEAHKAAYSTDIVKKQDHKVVCIKDGFRLTDRNDEITYKKLQVNELIDNIAYNCKYMIDALTALKKLKVKGAKLYFYGSLRPVLLVAENVEILILPCRLS